MSEAYPHHPNPFLSGKAIAEQLVVDGSHIKTIMPEQAYELANPDKIALNERLRAERFGIMGAIVDRFASEAVSTAESGRPALSEPMQPRPLAYRAMMEESFNRYGDDGPGTYRIWSGYKPASKFEDVVLDFNTAMDARLSSWANKELADDGEVYQWARRLRKVGDEQRELFVAESILIDPIDNVERHILGGDTLEPDIFSNVTDLPVGNIGEFYGPLAEVALHLMDRNGINDETERLRILDDIVLQIRDVSQHHLAHFNNADLADIRDSVRILDRGAVIVQDESGRYHLDWKDRVKPKPKDQILSRTQHCVAAYRVEGKPSAIENLGWAFNTELQRLGLLAPGAAFKQPEPYEFPKPHKISDR